MNEEEKVLMFREKVLVDEREYKRMKQTEEDMRMKQKQLTSYDNIMRTLTFLKDDMDTIILREDLTVDQKLKLFQAAQQRFDQVKSSQSAQTPDVNARVVVTAPAPAQANASATEPTAVIVKTAGSNEDIIEPKSESVRHEIGDIASELKIDKRYQAKLTDLIKHLRKKPDVFAVANTGELVLHGKVVNGSNMSDLMRNLYRPNKRHNLTGNVEFMQALANAHTPMSYISNSKVRSYMTRTPQTGQGVSRSNVPPGKAPRILCLYK